MISIRNIGQGFSQISITENGTTPLEVVGETFPSFDFGGYTGNLYIGGHPNIGSLRSARLQNTADLCIDYIHTANKSIPLIDGDSPNYHPFMVQPGCPASQCSAAMTVTLTNISAYLGFNVYTRDTSDVTGLTLIFRTRFVLLDMCTS